jgi:hypothetical protein
MVPKYSMYIRKKAIRNKKTGAVYHYAYVVENRWRKKGARQKVKHYLGKVYSFPLAFPIEFFAHCKVEEGKEEWLKALTAKQLIQKLVEWELARHKVEGIELDRELGTISKERKPASIEMGEGMLNSYTLKQLLFFVAEGDEEQDGYRLAKAFVEAGIQVPQEVFIAVFSKVMERGKV